MGGIKIRNVGGKIHAEGNEIHGATRVIFEFDDPSQVPNLDDMLECLPKEFRYASVTFEGPSGGDGMRVLHSSQFVPLILQAPEEKRHSGPSL